ncbi:UDP-N-acetylmuramate dehydrogenase [Candidatus Parcubacteria bacterium]|nr:MAG: UDP-N-acetylmuramate dehydrogenase [Candidatus Parcubacteria bacterium]
MSLNVQENIPLASLTTFEIGGAAKYFVEVKTEADIQEAIQWAKEKNVPFVILAGGSNLLIPDGGLSALVIRVVGDDFSFSGNTLEAHPGCNLLSLIRLAGEKGLGGWEKLAGIPGTIGGAVRGNAGAFGPEIKDFVDYVRALNIETGETREFSNTECTFSYRNSFFKQNPNWIVARVFLNLESIDPAESKRESDNTIAEREKRHIQNVRAAGSFFMNPVAPANIIEMFEKEKQVTSRGGRVPAGWLIEKAGMKGASVGDAQASLQHPNYIVNNGNATAQQVRELAEKIKKAVLEQFGVQLTEEAVILE